MRGFAILASFCVATCACSNAPRYPYQDARLSVDQRTEDLLHRMTPQEKRDFMMAGHARLGIPKLRIPEQSSPVNLEATWNPEVVSQLARAVALRDPAFDWQPGDPWLESRMAVAWVSGVQSQEGGIAVMRNLPCAGDETTLRQDELPPFRAAIEEAGLWAIDAGPCANNTPLLTDIIDRDWGFRGFVFSKAGPAPPGISPDDQARRILRAMFAAGLFDGPPRKPDPAEQKRVERIAAEQSVVLLKNDYGLLPVYATGQHSIGVTGNKQQVDAIRVRAGSTPVVEGDVPNGLNIVFAPDGTVKVFTPIANALLKTWNAGPESAQAATDVIFGDVNPSGKLPAPFDSYPFGFGLSYTTFEWSDLKIFPATPRYGQLVQVVVKVRNTGPRAGAETVELYIHDELKAFRHVELKPGEAQDVPLTLDRHSMSHYDPAVHDWATEPGLFEVAIGTSSRDIRLKGSFQLFP